MTRLRPSKRARSEHVSNPQSKRIRSSYQLEGDNIRESDTIESTSDTESFNTERTSDTALPDEGQESHGEGEQSEGGQSDGEGEQSDGEGEQSEGEGEQSEGEGERTTDESERTTDESEQSTDESEQSSDERQQSDDERQQSDDERQQSDDERQQSNSSRESNGNIRSDTIGIKQFALRESSFLKIFEHVLEVVQCAEYVPLPEDKISPKKRIILEDSGDPISVVKGYFSFACPYYAHNPGRYKDCLSNHLTSIEGVRKHLEESHREPPYCCICKAEFEKCQTRDQHTREGRCREEEGTVDGLSGRNMRRILNKKNDRIEKGEKKRWLRFWKIAFPDLKAPEPYLDKGFERWKSISQDYWNEYGHSLVSDELWRLQQHSSTPEQISEVLQDEAKLKALCGVILHRIWNTVPDYVSF